MEKNNENKQNDNVPRIELVENTEPKRKIWIDWISCAVSIISALAVIIGVFITVPNVINNAVQNSNDQKQTQVVIEPRDGDIIVKDGDDYKLLQLIELSDISFPSKVQEVQYNKGKSTLERVDINNTNSEDWSKRDSFVYIINSFSINPNKVINLLDNIKRITVYCDFYEEKNISKYIDLGEKSFKFEMIGEDKTSIETTKTNVISQYEYVTKELNDGIEWMKIRVEIIYEINEKAIVDTISTDWIETSADYFG